MKTRIGGSVLIGVMLIAGAFFFGNKTAADVSAGVIVVPQGTREYQETKDTDGDGTRDWQEELQGTDPLVPNAAPTQEEADKIYNMSSSSEELPDTVTNRFARTFFEKYFNKSLGTDGIEEAAKTALIDGSIDSVAKEVADDFYTRAHVRTIQTASKSDLHAYGNAVATIFEDNQVKNENELLILERALQTDNAEELKNLDPIIAAYRNILDRTRMLPVPEPIAQEHLNLLNTALAIHNDVVTMRNSFTDPLPALIRTKRYMDDAVGLYTAIDNLRTAFEQAGVVYREDEPGVFFFKFRP